MTGKYVIESEFKSLIGYIYEDDPDDDFVSGLGVDRNGSLITNRETPTFNMRFLKDEYLRPLTKSDIVLYGFEKAFITLATMVAENEKNNRDFR